jgi:hypothetical protein
LERRLIEHWPSWFKITGNIQETRMPDGFVHGDGWFELVWRLCEDLELLVVEAESASGQAFRQKTVGYRSPRRPT